MTAHAASPSSAPSSRALDRATLALALIAAGTYAMAELVSRDGSALPIAGLVACACAPALSSRRRLGPRAAAGLSVAAVGLALLDWWLGSGDAVMALGRAVLGLLFVRLWAPLGTRERWQVFVLSLTHLAAASVVTVDILFAVFLAVYAVVGTCALALQYLDAESAACGAPPPRATARFLAGISGLAVVAILLTAAIFLVVPRVGAGLLQFNTRRNTVKVAGFSDSVQIGDIGEILQGSEPVMRVKFPDGGDGEGTRFRGRVFERCTRGADGRYHWTVPDPIPGIRRVNVDVTRTTDPRIFAAGRGVLASALRTGTRPSPDTERVHHRIYLQPLSSPALFLAGPPAELRFERPGLVPDRIRLDPNGTVVEWERAARAGGDEIVYEAVSWIDPTTGTGGAAPAPTAGRPRTPDTADECRRMPEGMAPALVERLRATAAAWVSGAARPEDAAELIQRRLRLTGGFRYTLDQPDPGAEDPIGYFLYTARAGHCEYYAVAMVVLMRSLGHPARLVTGFLGGEVNPIDGYRVVRQSDAHAWVEVLTPTAGWVTYDPTPRADAPAGALAIFRQFFDYLRFRWYSGVVDYDVRDQQRALEGGVSRLREWGAAIRRSPGALARRLRGWRGAVGAGCILAGVWLLLGRRRRSHLAGPRRSSIAFYEDLLHWLGRRGVARRPAQTPRELAAVARAEGIPAVPVDTLTDLFCRARYGGARLDASADGAVRAALDALRTTPPSTAAAPAAPEPPTA